ncbi:MAG: glycosyltransferase [Vicingaceae bacterium]
MHSLVIPLLVLVSVSIILAYAWLIRTPIHANGRQSIEPYTIDKPSLSIVIPFRNEEKNLKSLLKELNRQSYAKNLIEVIAVDDHSEDNSNRILEETIDYCSFRFKLIRLTKDEKGKKMALSRGIEAATSELIICTDADTSHDEKWLEQLTIPFNDHKVEMIIGPVGMHQIKNRFHRLQNLELLAFQYITLSFALRGDAILCNGANLAFRKATFNRLGGYSQHRDISSGDDLFLMLDLKQKAPFSIVCANNRDAFAKIRPSETLGQLVAQKVRWASKSIHVHDKSFLYISSLFALSNAWLLLLPILEWGSTNWPLISIAYVTLKFVLDFHMITQASKLNSIQLKYVDFFLGFLCYPFYLLTIFFASMTYKPTWKGRKIAS